VEVVVDADARRRAEEVVKEWWIAEYGHEPWKADAPQVERWITLIADVVAQARIDEARITRAIADEEAANAVAQAKIEGANEEAAKHADCCVDREEIERLRKEIEDHDCSEPIGGR